MVFDPLRVRQSSPCQDITTKTRHMVQMYGVVGVSQKSFRETKKGTDMLKQDTSCLTLYRKSSSICVHYCSSEYYKLKNNIKSKNPI